MEQRKVKSWKEFWSCKIDGFSSGKSCHRQGPMDFDSWVKLQPESHIIELRLLVPEIASEDGESSYFDFSRPVEKVVREHKASKIEA